jgi:hypothetical protein
MCGFVDGLSNFQINCHFGLSNYFPGMLFRCPACCVRFRTRGVTTWLVFLFSFGWHGFHGQVKNVLAFFNCQHKSKSLFYQGTIRVKVK